MPYRVSEQGELGRAAKARADEMSSYEVRVEIPEIGCWAYEGPEFPVFGVHAAGNSLMLHTMVMMKRARDEGLTEDVVEHIINDAWVVDHIEREVHLDLRRTVYLVIFNKRLSEFVTP